ncbi:MAG: hypothetical protein WKF31_10480 [Thermoleophilaceae bacterium]
MLDRFGENRRCRARAPAANDARAGQPISPREDGITLPEALPHPPHLTDGRLVLGPPEAGDVAGHRPRPAKTSRSPGGRACPRPTPRRTPRRG